MGTFVIGNGVQGESKNQAGLSDFLRGYAKSSEPQPRMGFSQISETTERIQLIRVPEPASQVLLSVVSDIFDENVGFTSA
jgi:hypothetical protein